MKLVIALIGIVSSIALAATDTLTIKGELYELTANGRNIDLSIGKGYEWFGSKTNKYITNTDLLVAEMGVSHEILSYSAYLQLGSPTSNQNLNVSNDTIYVDNVLSNLKLGAQLGASKRFKYVELGLIGSILYESLSDLNEGGNIDFPTSILFAVGSEITIPLYHKKHFGSKGVIDLTVFMLRIRAEQYLSGFEKVYSGFDKNSTAVTCQILFRLPQTIKSKISNGEQGNSAKN